MAVRGYTDQRLESMSWYGSILSRYETRLDMASVGARIEVVVKDTTLAAEDLKTSGAATLGRNQ
jgi:hypothetical protein